MLLLCRVLSLRGMPRILLDRGVFLVWRGTEKPHESTRSVRLFRFSPAAFCGVEQDAAASLKTEA
jgi:hypothetical protein